MASDSMRSKPAEGVASGTRSVCELGLEEIKALPADEPQAENLEPGDIILCRSVGNWLSDLIAGLDGYWTHTAMYCGDSTVVHAYTAGVDAVDFDGFISRYWAGAAVARPSRSAAERRSAARFALELAEADPHTVHYSGWDLGVAFATLRRARGRAAWRSLPPADSDLEVVEGLPWNDDEVSKFSSTCSGLVYKCYSEGARAPLAITPAPGLAVEDDRLVFLDYEEDLYQAAVEQTSVGEVWTSDLEGIGRPDLLRWRDRILLVGGALAGWAFFAADDDRSVPLEQGVSPADLWCSDDIGQRWFVTADHAHQAAKATAGCGDDW